MKKRNQLFAVSMLLIAVAMIAPAFVPSYPARVEMTVAPEEKVQVCAPAQIVFQVEENFVIAPRSLVADATLDSGPTQVIPQAKPENAKPRKAVIEPVFHPPLS